MSSLQIYLSSPLGDDYKCLLLTLQIYFFLYFQIPVHIQIQRARMLELFLQVFSCARFCFRLNLLCRTFIR